MDEEFKERTFYPSGQLPLKAPECIQIGKADTKSEKSKRWFTAELFKTKAGKYICIVSSVSTWQGELEHTAAEIFDDGKGLATWLMELHPWTWFPGFPPGQQFDEKRKRLEFDLKSQFDKIISDLLKTAPDSARIIE